MTNPFTKLTNKIKDTFRREIIITTQAGTGISSSLGGGYGGSGYGGNKYGNGAKFSSGMSSGAPLTIHDHFSARQYARDAMYDGTVPRALVNRYADTIVDIGLKLKPTPMSKVLGITPEQAEEWAENVAESFHLWAKSKKSHRSRINTFYQNQRLYSTFQWRDNDMFTRFFYSREKDLYNPLQIDFVDPNQINGYGYTSTYTQIPGDYDGIIKDESGRETGYKTWYTNKNGEYVQTTIPAVGAKSKRTHMIHGFNPDYAGQTRGFSMIADIVQDSELFEDFKLSHIKKAIAQSSIAMAVENEEQDPSNPLEDRIAGPMAEYGTIGKPPTDDTVTGELLTEPNINYTAIPEATINEPGSVGVFNMKRGDKLKNMSDTSPSAQFDSFSNAFVSYLAASKGMPVEVLLMKFSNNYSASRGTLILFWRIAVIWREEMNADFNNPIYESWLSEEIAAGRISAPGWSDPRMRAAWLNAEWAGAPMPNIDPLKTAAADKEYVGMGAQTLDDVARNFNGSSGKHNRMKLVREYAEWPPPPWNSVAPVEEKQEKSEEDDE